MINIHLGECLELMADIPDKSVDAIICDLPYGTTQNKWDCVIPLDLMWKEYKRICKGAIVLTAQTPFDKVLGASNIDMLKYEWIWQKSKATGHLNAKKAPMKNHENIVVFYDKFSKYNPQGLIKKEIPTIRIGRDNGSNYGNSAKDAIQEYENYPKSIIYIPSEGKTVHPTQKPVALMEYLVKTYTNEGDTVLDNCMGSGTTGVACKNLNRKFIGIEQDLNYFLVSEKRIFYPQINHNSL